MTENKWGFPLLIVAVLLITSLLTVIFPAVTRNISQAISGGSSNPAASHAEIPSQPVYQENVRIDVEGYIVGEELVKIPALGEFNSKTEAERTYTSLSLLAIITAIVIGGLIAFTIPIAGLAMLASRGINRTQNDKSYEAAATSLENKIAARFNDENKEKPVTGKPETHSRPARDAWAAILMVLFLTYMAGYVLGDAIMGNGRLFANVFAILTIVIGYFYFRPARIEAIDATENSGFNRGLIWVVASGALMMGIGIGLMYIVMSGNDPFPWITWDQGSGPRIDRAFFIEWFDQSGLRISEWN